MNKQALLIVDVQNDFCPGGRLTVPQGDRIVPVLNSYIAYFSQKGDPIMASRDWHPAPSKHFKTHGGPWPEHCIQNTHGADFPSGLRLPPSAMILSKGMQEDKDGYSVFEAQDNAHEDFIKVLKRRQIGTLFIGGLATEFCVQATVLDALKNGLNVYLLTDAIKGIDEQAVAKAMDTMLKTGAKTMTLAQLGQKQKNV